MVLFCTNKRTNPTLGANRGYALKNIYFTIKNHILLRTTKCRLAYYHYLERAERRERDWEKISPPSSIAQQVHWTVLGLLLLLASRHTRNIAYALQSYLSYLKYTMIRARWFQESKVSHICWRDWVIPAQLLFKRRSGHHYITEVIKIWQLRTYSFE